MQAMKKQKSDGGLNFNPFDVLSEELIFSILDLLNTNLFDKKSFSLVCKSFYTIEARHRRTLKPLRPEHLLSVLRRYPSLTHLDLTACPRLTDNSLHCIAHSCKSTLRSIDLSQSKFFTSSGLLSLVYNCKNLRELDLSNATDLRDTAAAVVAQASNLEKLWLGRCKLITDMGIGCIAVGCTKLKLLSLKWCVGVGDLGVELIAIKCNNMRILDLSYLPITEKCLPPLLKLQHLEDLVLEGCFGIDDAGLSLLKHGCSTLKKLDISSCQNISDVGLSLLTSGSGCLEQLTLAHGPLVTSALVDSLNKLPILRSIVLDGCVVTPTGIKGIGIGCPSLTELSFSKCLGVTDKGLSFLASKLKDLRKLDITCCREITDDSIANITNSCPNLISIRMESCTHVSSKAFSLIGQRCRFLEELDLTDNEIDDEGLKAISQCSKLSSLKLGICLNITDQGLEHLAIGCPDLKELDLYRSTGITDSGISAVAGGCPGLEMVNMAYSADITDSALISLSKCSRLKALEIRGCPLITSLGLAAIAMGCRQLKKLDIKKCPNIDDSGMIALAHFSQNLRQINLSYSSVTDVGLLSLASLNCLMNLTILHLKGLTPRGLTAALLACGGLTKVKLHTLFRSLLPQALFEHLEARGCVLQWRNKVVQAELDPKCWKLQWEDIM